MENKDCVDIHTMFTNTITVEHQFNSSWDHKIHAVGATQNQCAIQNVYDKIQPAMDNDEI